MDRDLDGVQKVHAIAVPRVGGIAVISGVFAGAVVSFVIHRTISAEYFVLMGCAVPVVVFGITEDLTKRVSARARLIGSAIAALIACYALKAVVGRVGVSYVDALLVIAPIATVFTVFAVSGVVHAFNIIDGMNGLVSVVSIVILTSIGFVAHQVDDPLVVAVSLAMVGAILGFLLWNYPVAQVFLGDGGAYFIGFVTAELLILLTVRNSRISPLYALLVTFYPVFETLFSIYRRRILRGLPVGAPDADHLHTLIFHRFVGRELDQSNLHARLICNSRTSSYLWVLNILAVAPATLFWDDPELLAGFAVLFAVVYVWLYSSIVKFRDPIWLR